MAVELEQKSWPHFGAGELSCRCCKLHWMDDNFMKMMEALRIVYDKPLVVT